MSRYKYDDNLEDSIFKASLILNLQEYRSNNQVKREAEKIRMSYEEINDKEAYKKIGMGKEALKQVFNWLNSDVKFNINKDDLLDVMEQKDILPEIQGILKSLQSDMLQKENISELEEYEDELEEAELNMDEDNAIDEILQLSLPLEK